MICIYLEIGIVSNTLIKVYQFRNINRVFLINSKNQQNTNLKYFDKNKLYL